MKYALILPYAKDVSIREYLRDSPSSTASSAGSPASQPPTASRLHGVLHHTRHRVPYQRLRLMVALAVGHQRHPPRFHVVATRISLDYGQMIRIQVHPDRSTPPAVVTSTSGNSVVANTRQPFASRLKR